MIDMALIQTLIAQGETLTCEFKSDLKCLSDTDLIGAVVCLANSEGGYLLVGVEDDGTVTGLHKKHQNVAGLAGLIASRTVPSLTVQTQKIAVDGVEIAVVSVPKTAHITATTDGLIQRRRLKVDNTPECVPFSPHEFIGRQASFGLLDPSVQPILGVEIGELSLVERQRLRQVISRYGGDSSLVGLSDEQLDGALSLTKTIDGKTYPTLTGLLLLGTPELLRAHLPSHEVAFQVLAGTEVRVNEIMHTPLLETFERVQQLFTAQVIEQETEIGLFRVPIPNYDRRAFREAFVNALVHRDYHRLGMVQVKIDQDGLMINSAGGFVEGVHLNNLLTTPPTARNLALADAMKRIGLAERTGRGIDRIYEGMLKYGRPRPDYSLSDSRNVSVFLANAKADHDFLRMVLEREQTHGEMPIESLVALHCLQEERRMTLAELSPYLQKSETHSRAIVEKLVEAGLIEAHGTGKNRTFTLSASVYQAQGEEVAYIRQKGFLDIQHEQMILNFLQTYQKIKRGQVMELCHLNKDRAYNMLSKMVKNDKIQKVGRGKDTHYELKT